MDQTVDVTIHEKTYERILSLYEDEYLYERDNLKPNKEEFADFVHRIVNVYVQTL